VGFLRRVPFTATVAAIILVVAIATGTLWSAAQDRSWYDDVAYGLPAFSDGKFQTLVLGVFFAVKPAYYVWALGLFALFTGFAEWVLGTRRTMVIAIGYQVVGVLGAALFLLIFRNSGWDWARVTAGLVDVNFTTGAIAVLCVASGAIRPPWRLRLRLAIWAFVLFGLFFIGRQANLEHAIAVLLCLPFSTRLAGPRGLAARALPTRHEIRLIAAVGAIVIAAVQLLGLLLPDRLTPFGETSADDSWIYTLVVVVVSLAIANGLRHGYRWVWVVAVVLCIGPLALLALVFGVVIWAAATHQPDVHLAGVAEGAASAVMYLAFLIVLFLGRSAFRVPRRSKRTLATSTSQPEVARELLTRWGGSTISWMTTWPENRHMVTADGQGYLAFRKHAGVAVALGDPVGPPGSAGTTVADFIGLCDRTAMVPYLFSSSAATAAITDALGWQSAQVAEDNLIDLPGLEFKGKSWQDIRTALNRAGKEGITFRMVTLADEPWSMVRQVEDLSQQWLGDKGLPEMGFTLGGVPEALDRAVKVGLAVDEQGSLHGVLSWMPVYAGDGVVRGWTLDLMRRRDGGFRSVIEFLIASSCLHFQSEGAQFLSLSGAPLARSSGEPPAETAIEKFLETLGESLEPVYGFRSLHAFKAKFKPRREPMYMIFRDEADLPRIGIAITRAYLPTAGVGDLISVVRH
jgi:lysylphosphatidylglycerol synthetase-like protein (DUF2156 family)